MASYRPPPGLPARAAGDAPPASASVGRISVEEPATNRATPDTGAPRPALRAGKVRVLIATTLGPVDVLLLTAEDPIIGRSVACIGGTTRTADIDADYHAFVDRATGVVERYYGPGCFRLDLAGPIDAGSSWQLGVLAAHALFAEGRLAEEHEAADAVLWVTGSVRAVDLAIGAVGHVPEKLALSLPRLTDEVASKRQVIVAVPVANESDIPAATRAQLSALGLEPLAVARAQELLTTPPLLLPKPVPLSRRVVPAAAPDVSVPTGVTPPVSSADADAPVVPRASHWSARAPAARKAVAAAVAALLALYAGGEATMRLADRSMTAAQLPFQDTRTPPLPTPMLASLRQEVTAAQAMLRRLAAQKMLDDPNNNTWGWVIAQMTAAAPPTDAADRAAYLAYMDRMLDRACGCYVVGTTKHAVTSAWSLISYARLRQAPPPESLVGVIERQAASGWWSAVLDAHDDERNASLYVTALMVIALRSVADQAPLEPAQKIAVVRAARRGIDWLVQQTPDASGEWADYPRNERGSPHIVFGSMILAAIDGLDLGLAQRSTGDAVWRSYKGLPPSHEFFPSDVMIMRSKKDGQIDGYRHVPYPWVAYGLTALYADRPLWDRARIASDLRAALLVNLQRPAFRKQEWLLAEHVFVMDRLLARLDGEARPTLRPWSALQAGLPQAAGSD